MTRQRLIEALGTRETFPWETVSECLSDPDRAIPSLLLLLEREARGLTISPEEERAIFLASHILAALRVSDAFAPLCDVLCRSPERAQLLFGDTLADSVPMALMALARNRAEACWACVANPRADWMVREAFLRAWTHEVLHERVPQTEAAERLRGFPTRIAPDPGSYLWAGWMTAIADLGLVELRQLVESLFATGHVARDEFGYLPVDQAAFREDLAEGERLRRQGALAHASWASDKGYRPLGPLRADFEIGARHLYQLDGQALRRSPYPAPLLRVAEPGEDFNG